jgi:hypothetical protein
LKSQKTIEAPQLTPPVQPVPPKKKPLPKIPDKKEIEAKQAEEAKERQVYAIPEKPPEEKPLPFYKATFKDVQFEDFKVFEKYGAENITQQLKNYNYIKKFPVRLQTKARLLYERERPDGSIEHK